MNRSSRLSWLRSIASGGPPPVLIALFGLLGFLVVTGTSAATAVRRAEAPRRAQLAGLITDRRSQVETLEDAVAELRAQAAEARRDAARRSAGDARLAEELTELSLLAGVSPVEGPGVEVRLSDSSRADRTNDDVDAYRVHDRDLQLVVNALLAAGAEAVAVNDVRLVATSPIRAAGQTIVAGFRPLNPPYVVRAVGADRHAFDRSDVARVFGRWRDVFGLGFRVRDVERLTVPGHAGRVAVSNATPAPVR